MRRLVLLFLLVPATGKEPDVSTLLGQVAGPHWRARWDAVEQLAATPPSRLWIYLRDPRPRVREAIAWVCFLEPKHANPTLLGLQLKTDKSAAVRRACARALVHHKGPRIVAALDEALRRETDRRTKLFIQQTRRRLTVAPLPRRTYDGVVLRTETSTKARRHIVVLPQYESSTGAFGPYLLPLLEHATLTWVRLPATPGGYGAKLTQFPIRRLVNALEAFRADRKITKLFLLGEGAGGWIALRYAQLHPRRCGGLILIDTTIDREAYDERLRTAAARGDAIARLKLDGPATPEALDRVYGLRLEQGFADRADLEMGWNRVTPGDADGFLTPPHLAWDKRPPLDVRALFLYSAASPLSGHVHRERIRTHLPNAMVVPIRKARALPYVEFNEELHKAIDVFLR